MNETTMNHSEDPRVWIGCLASYNAGRLFGRWIEVSTEIEDLQEEIADLLRESTEKNVDLQYPGWKAEEFHLCDLENFGPFASELGRYSGVEEICAAARAILEVSDSRSGADLEMLEAACNAFDVSTVLEGLAEDGADWLTDRVRWVGQSYTDIGYEIAELYMPAIEALPPVISNAIDYEKIGRECAADYAEGESDGGTIYYFDYNA